MLLEEQLAGRLICFKFPSHEATRSHSNARSILLGQETQLQDHFETTVNWNFSIMLWSVLRAPLRKKNSETTSSILNFLSGRVAVTL